MRLDRMGLGQGTRQNGTRTWDWTEWDWDQTEWDWDMRLNTVGLGQNVFIPCIPLP